MARRPFGRAQRGAIGPELPAQPLRNETTVPLRVSASRRLCVGRVAVANRYRNLTSHCDIWLRPWPRRASAPCLRLPDYFTPAIISKTRLTRPTG